jgi:hypothetical protein
MAMLTKEETTKQTVVVTARKYYDGDHSIFLTDRQKAWIDQHKGLIKFKVNLCADVVDSIVEKLEVAAFAVHAAGAANEKVGLALQEWWMDARMPTVAAEAHTYAGRDGEAFVLVDWDVENNRPKFILHPRFIDKQAGGDDFGMRMDYPNGNYLAEPIRAVKEWWEKVGTQTERRQTRYYPDRIEKYLWKMDQWMPFIEKEIVESDVNGEKQFVLQDAAWPVPWLTKEGKPIGIPVGHLTTQGMKSDLVDVITLQDILNKQWLDLLATADATGFRLLFTFGFVMTTDGKPPAEDGSNLVKITPGNAYGTSAKPADASVQSIEAGDLKDMLELEERIVYRVADVSDVPMSRFQTTKAIAGAETLKQQEAPFTAKIERRQSVFGDAWGYVMGVALRLSATFGTGAEVITADAAAKVRVIWKPAEVRNDKEKAEIAKEHKALGVPEEFLWKRQLGYTDEDIVAMKATPEWKSREKMRANLAAIGGNVTPGGGDRGQEDGETTDGETTDGESK